MAANFLDSIPAIKSAMQSAVDRALERCGAQAEGYAVDLCPVDTGRLRSSIAHTVVEGVAYIGTNTEYAPYVEYGTGHYSTVGGGTPKERWVYCDALGQWHMGYPQVARPFLKPAVANHGQTYKNIFEDEIKNMI